MKVEAPLNLAIGRRLRELREARGIRKERVALSLDMSAQNWALYEAGKQKLTVTMLPVVAEVYSMTVAELVVALFDLREICNIPSISAKQSDDSSSANYNYTKHRNGFFGTEQSALPALALAGAR